MKDKIIDEIKEIFTQSANWVKLEVEYAKLTAAEKFTILLSTLILGAIILLIGIVALILFAFALADVFKLFLSPPLACCAVGGILILLILILYFFRKQILFNPIARFISRLFLDPGK